MAEYAIIYEEQAAQEIRALRRRDQATIFAAVDRHLRHEPTRVSRSSIKKLDPPILAAYRLRVGEYRIFYDVEEDNHAVVIMAVRAKGSRTLEEIANGNGS